MPTELTAQFRQLAGATVPCPNQLEGGNLYCEADYTAGIFPHDVCNGTGRVYLFGPEVRVPCPPEKPKALGLLSMADIHWQSQHEMGRCDCGGTGWVPSENGLVWLKVLDQARLGPAVILEVLHNSTQGVEHFVSVVIRLIQGIEGVKLG